MDKREELLRAADSFDDVLVDADGLCRWADVADALGIMRRKLADYTRAHAQPGQVSGDERMRARLAWCNYPDTPESRAVLAGQDEKDPYSAAAWDRVIAALAHPSTERGTTT